MKKRIYAGVLLVLSLMFLVGCNLGNAKEPTTIEKEIIQIESDITETFERISKGCVGIYAKGSQSSSVGSGVVYKEKNGLYYVVSNQHVVSDMTSFQIYMGGSRYYRAQLVGTDKTNDISVLTFSLDLFGGEVYVNDIFNYTEEIIIQGQTVLAIGCPLGLENYNTLTTGVVSRVTSGFIQTDVAINPGNSGGGLFNMSGRLVGINTEKQVYTQASDKNGNIIDVPVEGMGYAISLEKVKNCITNIEAKNGDIQRPTLGIEVKALNRFLYPDLTENKYLPNTMNVGCIISNVKTGSCAEAAGLKANDVIISVNDKSIVNLEEISDIISLKMNGDMMTMVVYRSSSATPNVTIKINL